MGNYYEGRLWFALDHKKLKEDKELYNILMIEWEEPADDSEGDILDIQDQLQKLMLDRKVISNANLIVPDCEIYYDDEEDEIAGIIIEYFTKKMDEFVTPLDFIKFLLPYKTENCNNIIGNIKDEDGHFFKNYVWDMDNIKAEIKARSHICNNTCDEYEYYSKMDENYICNHYSRCNRAYNIGCNNLT